MVSLGIEHGKSLYPQQLSGGMKMRAALARALSQKSKILLMDEPLAALDEQSRHKLQEDLLNLISKGEIQCIFMVTHSIEEAVFLSDEILLFGPKGKFLKIYKGLREDKERSRQTSEIRYQKNFLDLSKSISNDLRDISE